MQTFQNPVGIITKNSLIERDLDILTEMAKHNLARVLISITTLDEDLRMKMEPRTSTVKNRLKTIERLSAAGIPTQVMIGPIIPGLTSHEMPEIIKRSAEHGAEWANFTMVRLNGVVAEVFENWLTTAYPDRASKVLNQIKEVNGGKLANTIAGARMTGKGDTAQTITNLFKLYRDKYMVKPNQEFAHHFFKRLSDQFSLF
jgi:DNA repair photolyase